MRLTTSFLGVLLCALAATAAEQPPNVIVVMTDDQGYGELSAHGNPVLETPHLDRLRSESVRLADFHVAPMCTPTRGQLLTGMDAARNGAINVSSGRALLRPEIPTMADIFADAGYRTGVFGKWHLGDNYPFRPEDRGFHETLSEVETPAATNFSGMSLAPVLRGDADVPEDRMLIINYSRMPSGFNYPSPYTQSILTRSQAGVLWKRWRLLEDRELYDLESDPLQTTNVIEQHPEVVAGMRDYLYTWWDEVAPNANEPQRIIIGNEIENPMMFTVSLPRGPMALHTWFEGEGEVIASAYYVYVRRR